MVPVRFVSESLGATVKWNNDTRTATITNEKKTITLTIGSKTVTDNGQAVELDTASAMVDGRTMVPLRFVSESLNSKVIWDQGGNAVQISDVAYQAKIANGTVKLDMWGRELATPDSKWNKLADMPSYVYSIGTFAETSNRAFFEKHGTDWADKEHIDMWAEKVRSYYQAQLNVDYRTINEADFTKAIVDNMSVDTYSTSQIIKGIPAYIEWVKKNHVVARGYADPENSLVSYSSNGPVFLVHFKFMIIFAKNRYKYGEVKE